MDLFDENSLPGVITDVQPDEELQYDTSLWGTTGEMIIIGTAFDGPVGKICKVYSPEYAEYMYGKVYDSSTRREATLVAAIKDAWDRGCRSIYACRISGKEIYKDYQLAIDSNLKLRVKGLYPSNSNKNNYFTFENGAENKITIYKPATRATIAEKKAGIVENVASVIKSEIDLDSMGIDSDSYLTELIDAFNGFVTNNVLRLLIVDENGNDVTLSNIEAKTLKVGDIFQGLYTIGRSANAKDVIADTKMEPVFGEKPYASFEGDFYKKLTLNTNVSRDIPIYSADEKLNDILGISSAEQYDFLYVFEKINEYFEKDSIDYEEVTLSDFEIYKRLGRGFADNAHIEYTERTLHDGSIRKKFKVKPVTDKNTKKSEIQDGIYSVLENIPCEIRVLAGIEGEKVVKGTLPKPDDFKFCQPQSVKMLNNSISITAKVDKKDLSKPKKYSIEFVSMTDEEEESMETLKDNLYKESIVREASLLDYPDIANIDKTVSYDEGSIFLITNAIIPGSDTPLNLLYSYTNNGFNVLHQFTTDDSINVLKDTLVLADGKIYKCDNKVVSTENANLTLYSFTEVGQAGVDNKDYFIVGLQNGSFIVNKFATVVTVPSPDGGVTPDVTETRVVGVGTLNNSFDYNDSSLLVSINQTYNSNKVTIKSAAFDFLTIEEVVDLLNNNKDFSKLFEAEVIDTEKAQDSIADLDDATIREPGLTAELIDKKIGYDTTLLIPYRTEDTFARQLAQHCYYTSLKTGSTHGIIGTQLLLNPSNEAITEKINNLIALNMPTALVAKKATGRTMLSKDNIPYYIGRKISVIVGQYIVNTDDNYKVLSNMAAGYGGMITTLSLDQAPTCQPIDVPDPVYELTGYQLTQLTNSGFVTIKNSFTKGWVITDGITMAPADSAFRRLSTSRISDYVAKLIREACEPFIGKENHLANQNSLRTAIKTKLQNIVGTLIDNYSFELQINKQDSKLGIIRIPYKIVPVYEIKEIINTIKVGD